MTRFGVLSCTALAVSGVLCACNARPGASDEAITIGFLVKQPEELWFQNEWRFAQQCADHYGFNLIKMGVEDGEKALNAIDVLGAKGARGFVICTPDVRLGPAIMARAKSYAMKVFTVDDQFVGADGAFMEVPYMGLSAREIGRNVGRALYEEFERRAWPVAETGACAITFDELNTVKERTDGSTEALIEAGFPADQIHRGAEKTLDVPGALDAAHIVLTQHPDIKRWLVFSVNDEGVLGALRAIEGRGFHADSVIGIGIGAGTGLAEFDKPTRTGYFATCMISPLRHGYEATEMLYRWIAEGLEPPMDTRTAGVLATRENYKEVVEKLGLADVLLR